MNDENPPNNGNLPPPVKLTAVAILQIMLLQDGSVELSGPVDDPLLGYAMLMKAHDRLKDYHDKKKAEGGLIMLAPGTKLKT